MAKKEELMSYWQKCAESDLVVAEHLFETGDYHYCLFLGHLMLEKALKALYVKNRDLNAPYKHSLPLLAQKAGVELTDDQETFLEEVSDFNIEARYPDIKFSFYKKCTKEFTGDYFKRIKEFYRWLKVEMKLEE